MTNENIRSTNFATSEFDRHAATYDELLDDPLRSAFTNGHSSFFHIRKRDLIVAYLEQLGIRGCSLRYLDLGCGRGELLKLLHEEFAHTAGCDVSSTMTSSIRGVDVRIQNSPETLPFESSTFDFITAVCVYHHVVPSLRPALTREIYRVLAPNGILVVIEHNPYNPVTRKIVSRTPVDASASLLEPRDCQQLMKHAGFEVQSPKYFLYFPRSIYISFKWLEALMAGIPLGGQYAILGHTK